MKKIRLILMLTSITMTILGQNLQWACRFGDIVEDAGNCIKSDQSGNAYTTGYFTDTVDFDPGLGVYTLTTTGMYDIFVSKLSASGVFQWAIKMGGQNMDMANSIALDGLGNTYITGFFSSTADFDPGPGIYTLTSAGGWDIFVAKLNPSGNFIWAKKFGGIGYDEGKSLTVDATGNVYITGHFSDTVDFNPGPSVYTLTSNGSKDIFVSKLDAAGNFMWAKCIGSSGSDQGNSIKVNQGNSLYVTGSFSGIVDFDPGLSVFSMTAVLNDYYILKLDTSGNFSWAKQIGGSNSSATGNSLDCDSQGNVYTTGSFNGTVDLDPGLGVNNVSSAGADDIFLNKLDAAGNLIWSKQFGSTYQDQGYSIGVDQNGSVYVTGSFYYTVDFDPGIGIYNLTAINSDVFIVKLNSSGNLSWACSVGGTANEVSSSIAVDGFNNIYLTGRFSGTVDFDPGVGIFNLSMSGIYWDVFILKLETSVSNLRDLDKASDKIFLYPNPNSGNLNLQIDSQLPHAKCLIFDAAGQKIYEQPVSIGINCVKLPVLPKGIYTYKVISEGEKIKDGKICIE